MSKLGIAFLIIALLGALTAGGAGFMLYQQVGVDKTDAQTAQQQASTASEKAKKAEADLKEAKEAADQANSQLSGIQSQVTDLTQKLGDAQKKADELGGQVTQAQSDAAAAKAQVDHIKSVLGDMSPEEAKAAVDKANQALAASQTQQKILEDQLAGAQTQIADLKTAINNKALSTMPPGITGKVTFVNRAWNFVVLNVGISNGVVPNGELIIYRGRDFLGKVKVTTVESTSAVADIEPGTKADIQIGDDVLN